MPYDEVECPVCYASYHEPDQQGPYARPIREQCEAWLRAGLTERQAASLCQSRRLPLAQAKHALATYGSVLKGRAASTRAVRVVLPICGHSLCRRCHERILGSTTRRLCPLCRKPIVQRSFRGAAPRRATLQEGEIDPSRIDLVDHLDLERMADLRGAVHLLQPAGGSPWFDLSFHASLLEFRRLEDVVVYAAGGAYRDRGAYGAPRSAVAVVSALLSAPMRLEPSALLRLPAMVERAASIGLLPSVGRLRVELESRALAAADPAQHALALARIAQTVGVALSATAAFLDGVVPSLKALSSVHTERRSDALIVDRARGGPAPT